MAHSIKIRGNTMLATPVIKNKFWIIEDSKGTKIGTIQNTTDGTKNVVLVTDKDRTRYPSIKVLGEKHNIKIGRSVKKTKAKSEVTVYGYPTSDNISFNEMYNAQIGLPVYTKTEDSKSFFCAGYYLISFSNNWIKQYCPKLLTLDRNDYKGPFYTEEQMKNALVELRK